MIRIVTTWVTALVLIGGSLEPTIARAAEPAAATTTTAPATAPETTAAPDTSAPAAPAVTTAPAPAPDTTEPSTTSWDDPAVPPPRITPANAPPADPPPQPRHNERGTGLLISGVILLGIGATSLLFIAGPSAIAKRVEMDRAESAELIGFSSRRQHYHRARIADDAMEAGFWIGISGLVLGTILAVTGGVMKSRARSRAMSRVGSGAGGLTLRF